MNFNRKGSIGSDDLFLITCVVGFFVSSSILLLCGAWAENVKNTSKSEAIQAALSSECISNEDKVKLLEAYLKEDVED
jgi:hypothetical protein